MKHSSWLTPLFIVAFQAQVVTAAPAPFFSLGGIASTILQPFSTAVGYVGDAITSVANRVDSSGTLGTITSTATVAAQGVFAPVTTIASIVTGTNSRLPDSFKPVNVLESLDPSDDSNYSRNMIKRQQRVDFRRYMEKCEIAKCTANHPDMKVAGNSTITATFKDSWTGVTGFTAVDHQSKEVYAAFRSTATVQQWAMNLVIYRKEPDNVACGSLHTGFLEAYESVRDELRASLTELSAQYPTYDLIFIGHSAAGPYATLAMADAYGILYKEGGYLLKTNGQPTIPKNQAKLFVFGSARVGTKKMRHMFADAGFKDVIRLSKGRDPIVHIPAKKLGYRHVGQGYWINPEGKWVTCTEDRDEEDKDCSGIYDAWDTLEFVQDDHYIPIRYDEYIECAKSD